LSAYVLNTNFDLSLNDISNNKQNYFTCIEPLIKNDISNNITIDLSAYALNTYVDTTATNLYSGDMTIYTSERQYPPKAYDSFTNEITINNEIFNINPSTYYKETITLNTTDITYGSGEYIIYSSSSYVNRN
jgi:hypothetical protein